MAGIGAGRDRLNNLSWPEEGGAFASRDELCFVLLLLVTAPIPHSSSLDAMHGFLLCCASKKLLVLAPCLLLGLHYQLAHLSTGFAAVCAVNAELCREPFAPSLHCPALSPIILLLPHINQDADRALDMPPS